MTQSQRVAIVGSGVFGLTAAIALRQRNYAVSVFDRGPIPHPLAASTDISKAVGMDYGAEADYAALAGRALEGWQRWNAAWPEPLFHQTGAAYLVSQPMAPGEFEHDTYALLRQLGRQPQRIRSADVRQRFPAWNAERYVDGYFNPDSGYAESGKVVARLVEEARRAGADLRLGQTFARLHEQGSRVAGIVNTDGEVTPADWVVVAAGAWTPHLLPHLAGCLRSVGQPVFHLAPADAAPYQAERFPVWGADCAVTGYYGFPANRDGVLKIANHGVGREMHPESAERVVSAAEEAGLREFLRGTFPGLAEAPIQYKRICLYCDTPDEHFWIAPDPQREGLVVATGDSGHAFKFAPVLGEIIADALEGAANPLLPKFRWRPEIASAQAGTAMGDPARHRRAEA